MNVNNLIQEVKNKLTTKQKVELFKELYAEISSKGVKGDTELAHINTFESRILRMLGGSGTINPETGLKQYFGGGGSGGGGSAPADTTNVQTIREAPGIEERKLGLMDISRSLAETPVNIPAYQVSPFTALEQQGFAQSAITGIGQAPVAQGITSLQGVGITLQGDFQGIGTQAAQGATAAGFQNYLNPYQSYITDEINRQAAQQRQQVAAQAIQSGAFGGGREGVQLAESERARLATIGQAQQQAFGQALGSFQTGLGQQIQAAGGQIQAASGQMQAATSAAQLGGAQQQMAQGDINQLMAAGGLQRQLAQQTVDAQRATELQRAYEPYQRAEFLKAQYQGGPTSQSGITAVTAPTTNPLAQAAGAGLGAYAAYQTAQAKQPQINITQGR
jgi:hypothetical protein